jgi:hypothetical protein
VIRGLFNDEFTAAQKTWDRIGERSCERWIGNLRKKAVAEYFNIQAYDRLGYLFCLEVLRKQRNSYSASVLRTRNFRLQRRMKNHNSLFAELSSSRSTGYGHKYRSPVIATVYIIWRLFILFYIIEFALLLKYDMMGLFIMFRAHHLRKIWEVNSLWQGVSLQNNFPHYCPLQMFSYLLVWT